MQCLVFMVIYACRIQIRLDECIRYTTANLDCEREKEASQRSNFLPSAKEFAGRWCFKLCLLLCPGESYVTLTHDALELTIQGPPIPKLCSELVKLGPHHKGTNVFRLALREPLPGHVRPYSTWTSPCSILPPPNPDMFRIVHYEACGIGSRQLASYWNAFLSTLFFYTYICAMYLSTFQPCTVTSKGGVKRKKTK